jgi:hypothetical protein
MNVKLILYRTRWPISHISSLPVQYMALLPMLAPSIATWAVEFRLLLVSPCLLDSAPSITTPHCSLYLKYLVSGRFFLPNRVADLDLLNAQYINLFLNIVLSDSSVTEQSFLSLVLVSCPLHTPLTLSLTLTSSFFSMD